MTTTALAGAVELLERALGYTRVVLGAVTQADLDRPTPCADWTLGDLLAHMEDALDAFTEAAGGTLARASTPVATATGALPPVLRIRDKACALLGAWSAPAPPGIDVEGRPVASELLLGAAALEVTVHGWDVARGLGLEHPLPEALAARLLDLAHALVDPADRVVRFAPARPVPAGAPAADRLLAWLGRTP